MTRVWTGVRRLARDFMAATAPRGGRDVLVQFSIMYALYYLYRITRAVAQGQEDAAFANADAVVRAERALGIYVEPWLQARFSGFEPLMQAMIWFYQEVHLPVIVVCLSWVFMRHRDVWPLFRNWFLSLNLIGLIGYTLVPTAPPRMLSWSGVVDMAYLYRDDVAFATAPSIFANPYAAMPSLHFAYALFVALCLYMLVRPLWLRRAAFIYPTVCFLAIVVTGNHFILDAVMGGVAVLVAWVVAVRMPAAEIQRERILTIRDYEL
ncbi:MAG TPA: phosphatase PAP2 family protein [Thermoleophilia bacterium]|nr:phosphatase PAP2 family protein [Thermoleophilia bacterium]HQG04126.1 phosphatase PAP2 family protein [Thermoleophilia bacterium]HQJ98325.1 phosphatase PAP2 family protein [Thermoleophilia bacterium]